MIRLQSLDCGASFGVGIKVGDWRQIRKDWSMNTEDEFLWWQRRAMLLACVGVLAYGIIEEPKFLIMLPILLLAAAVALGGIARDRR